MYTLYSVHGLSMYFIAHRYHKATLSYTPHGKEWIKSKVYEILTKQVK